MEFKQPEGRIESLETDIDAIRTDSERLLDVIESYHLKARIGECHPMEDGAIVSLGPLDEWCHAYTNRHVVESDDYLTSVGIRRSASNPLCVSFADAVTLTRKLWVYVSSFMNGGHDFLFDSAKVYLSRASKEHLRSERWIERRKQALEQLLKLEEQFVALAHLNASLPANPADVYLTVFEELLLDADEKLTHDIGSLDDTILDVELLTTLMAREAGKSSNAIVSFDKNTLATALSGNSFIDFKFVDLSPLVDLGIIV